MSFPGLEPIDPKMIRAMRRDISVMYPGLRHYWRALRKRNARRRKRHDIETRQVARAEVIVNRAPALFHKGRKP